jgi:hypothetical protein
MRIVLLVVFVVLSGALTAHAQPGMTPIQPFEQPQPAPQRVTVKDETAATAAAIGATALGYVLVFTGIRDSNPTAGWSGIALTVIGPSAGHIYAGENAHAGELSLIRAGGLMTMVLGFASSDSGKCVEGGCSSSSGSPVLIALGAGVFLGATIYDLFDAHRAAARTNAREWLVTPTVMAAGSGGLAPALALAGRF